MNKKRKTIQFDSISIINSTILGGYMGTYFLGLPWGIIGAILLPIILWRLSKFPFMKRPLNQLFNKDYKDDNEEGS